MWSFKTNFVKYRIIRILNFFKDIGKPMLLPKTKHI